ncbi:hypothetical protein QTG54_016167 [Skeletonema marinoi]|uniref:Uncharacterized protein n=1 Tax=Skeletonema marinoi TaxID=267567 RepID=A0AAD8XTI0_9STRA|nr:hypothetical protein QTG54_016167 [Skeletonema marinoi]
MPPPEENSNKRNKMLLVQQYTNSFSNIDWGGLGKSTRRISIKPRQQLPREFSAYSIDIPSMDDEGGVGVATSGGKKKKGKQQRRLSVTFDLNDEMIDNSCHEDIMEDGQRICAEKSKDATRSSKSTSSSSSSSSRSWCLVLVFTLLAIVVGAVVCFVVFLPLNTATLNWKKAMSGMRDWKSSNNNVVQQQLLQQQQGRGQEMLELAEQITAVCGGESSRSSTGTSSSCQELCHNHMCCVEQNDEYSCKDDVMKDCGVYAGCMVLIDDNLW